MGNPFGIYGTKYKVETMKNIAENINLVYQHIDHIDHTDNFDHIDPGTILPLADLHMLTFFTILPI